ncbi:MAG: ATP-binding protein [Tunicatimonas sp.]
MYERQQKGLLLQRISEPRRFIQVIYGPRQVGKTTMVTQLINELAAPVHFAAADAVGDTSGSWIEQQWEAARLKLKTTQAPFCLLVVDEIQKIQRWSEFVKQAWDKDTRTETNVKVILLGSSRLLLQQGLTESLAGRFETHYMGHWSFLEMRNAFGMSANEFAWYGGYPGAAFLIDDEPRWRAYVRDALIETSISKDILMLTRVDKPALMKRLFELGALYSGQILSYTKMLGQLQDAGNTTTLSHYLELLSTAGLLSGIEKFDPATLRQRASSPKFQVHNTALMSAQTSESFQQVYGTPKEWGRWVESVVGAHLLNASLTEDFRLFYWRQGNQEVDFVLEKGEKVIGLEVKSGSSGETSGMQAFHDKFSPEKVFLVGKSGTPWPEFLTISPSELF